MDDIDLNPFRRRLLKHGEAGEARVLEIEIPGNQSPGVFLTHKYVVEVHPAGAPAFQAKVKDAFNIYWAPKRGDLIKVKFNAKSRKVAFDLAGDPRYDASLQKQTGQWTEGESPPPSIFGPRAAGAPGAAAIAAAIAAAQEAAAGSVAPAQRLQRLTELRDGGLITAEDFEAQKLRILESL